MMSDPAPPTTSITPPDSPQSSKYWTFVLRLLPVLAGVLWLSYFALGWEFLFAPAVGVTIAALLGIGSRWL